MSVTRKIIEPWDSNNIIYLGRRNYADVIGCSDKENNLWILNPSVPT
jgi:hypothetical protein